MHTTRVAAPPAAMWDFFSDPRNLARLTPAWLHLRVVDGPHRIVEPGTRLVVELAPLGIRQRWTQRIAAVEPGVAFTDVQEQGPFHRFEHTHALAADGDGTRVEDRIAFAVAPGGLGRVAAPFAGLVLRGMFRWRGRRLRELFGAPGNRPTRS